VPTGQVVMATVLVVEDETLIRELVAEELEEAGYTVVAANNAAEAIAILEARQDIHLVFTDIDMPGYGRAEISRCGQGQVASSSYHHHHR
jgi:CheY-like chemotaxis protein